MESGRALTRQSSRGRRAHSRWPAQPSSRRVAPSHSPLGLHHAQSARAQGVRQPALRRSRGSFEALARTPTPELRRRLLALPGVGPETADAILLYALGSPVPVADEYLRRIALRHGLVVPCRPAPKSLTIHLPISPAAPSPTILRPSRPSSSMSYTRSPWRWAKHIAGERLAARIAHWPAT